MGQNNW